jgi:rhamnosyltransferase
MNLNKFIAVIVLYHCTLEESLTFQALMDAVSCGSPEPAIPLHSSKLAVLVYNNSPAYWNYEGQAYEGIEIIYVSDPVNSGVSKAYNEAYNYACRVGKEFLLLLDQDTRVSKDLFAAFFDAHSRNSLTNIGVYCPMVRNNTSLVSPAKFIFYRSREIHNLKPGVHSLQGLAIINSGLIIYVSFFGRVGGYNEKIKLDFSDFDFLRRSLRFSKQVIVLDTTFHHSLSRDENIDVEKALARFNAYLEGALHFYKYSYLDRIGLYSWVFMRSLKMNFRYQTFKFSKKAVWFFFGQD